MVEKCSLIKNSKNISKVSKEPGRIGFTSNIGTLKGSIANPLDRLVNVFVGTDLKNISSIMLKARRFIVEKLANQNVTVKCFNIFLSLALKT